MMGDKQDFFSSKWINVGIALIILGLSSFVNVFIAIWHPEHYFGMEEKEFAHVAVNMLLAVVAPIGLWLIKRRIKDGLDPENSSPEIVIPKVLQTLGGSISRLTK